MTARAHNLSRQEIRADLSNAHRVANACEAGLIQKLFQLHQILETMKNMKKQLLVASLLVARPGVPSSVPLEVFLSSWSLRETHEDPQAMPISDLVKKWPPGVREARHSLPDNLGKECSPRVCTVTVDFLKDSHSKPSKSF